MNSLVISAECPSCGAPLDFTEGSNAITCKSCKSNLLVTGKKQTLSYFVRPKLDARMAEAKAFLAQKERGFDGFSGKKSQLYFIPYYRLTGQEFDIEKAPQPAMQEDDSSGEAPDPYNFNNPFARQGGGSFLSQFKLFLAENDQPAAGPSLPANPNSRGEALFNDRYVEKSFLACNLGGLGIYSLGVRPAVLKLELFQRETVDALGKVVNPSLSPEEAERAGMKTFADPAILNRLVIGKVLSIIYFPFWLVEMASRGQALLAIIDAVSQSVIKADAPETIYRILDEKLQGQPVTVGFRPLTCPNCGWDFPLRADDSVFCCTSCGKAWRLSGSELNEIPCRIAGFQLPGGAQVKYLPFWVFQKPVEGTNPFRFFIPVFRYRRLKVLLDLAMRVSRVQPSYNYNDEGGKKDLSGCYYDEDEAALLAGFAQAALQSLKNPAINKQMGLNENGPAAPLANAVLTWFPFQEQGEYLLPPFGGPGILKNLLQF
ncbi:MAG: hypothetical protein M0Z52_01140 [Actinomycetota bacterium]|nr:hypothetical protein [Actinomycetota bacterium]